MTTKTHDIISQSAPVRIDSIQVFHVAMPLKQPWKTSFSVEHNIDSVLVRMTSGDLVGWGEAAPYSVPQFSPEWAAGCFQLIRDVFAPMLRGKAFAGGKDVQTSLASFKGNHFAKGAIDNAFWDLLAKRRELPLWRLVGGTDPKVSVGADIPVQDDVEILLASVAAAQEAGFSRTKLKFRPDTGVDPVRRVRERFPDAVIHIDCNCGFTLNDLPLFRELDELQLAMIEQPLAGDDLLDHARLQSELKTPICLDESITSVERARKAVESGAARWINIKHGRLGGLTNALAVQSFCVEQGIPCWIGGMLESFVGQGPSLALATLPGCAYAADIFPAGRLYEEDLAVPPLLMFGPGTICAPETPGIGFEPDEDRLRQFLIQSG